MTPDIKPTLDAIGLPQDAVTWLVDLWGVIQFFDDVADGDETTRPELDRALAACLVSMPANPFFADNATVLLPVVSLSILKWQASDFAERNNRASAQSYMWRAGFYDVVLMVASLCGPVDARAAYDILSFYAETLEDYAKEFPNA